jgi:hypothetical protein
MTQSIPETRSEALTDKVTPDLVSISDLDQFVALLAGWHKNRVDQMKALMDIPEDTEVTTDDQSQPVILTGDVRTGFLIGITTGLAILGKLPFVAEIDEEVVTNAGIPDA